MDIGSIGGGFQAAQSPTGMPPLSDAGSILAQSLVSDDSGAFMDGYEVELSAAALEG